jgi:hypothetical protein
MFTAITKKCLRIEKTRVMCQAASSLVRYRHLGMAQATLIKSITILRHADPLLINDCEIINYKITKLRGFSPQANYTDRATTACRRS